MARWHNPSALLQSSDSEGSNSMQGRDLMIDDRSHLVLACLVWIVLLGLIACEIALVGGILLSVLLDASSPSSLDSDSGPSGAERRSRV